MKQGGAIANKTGNNLERFIEDILKGEGYIFIDKDKFISHKLTTDISMDGIKIFTTQFKICNGIYDTPIRCDFVLYNSEKYPNCLVIESKWQQSQGSVDEKFPYLERNIKEKYPCDTIIILDGGGYKPGANKWLRSQVGSNLIGVFNMVEFMTYVNKDGL